MAILSEDKGSPQIGPSQKVVQKGTHFWSKTGSAGFGQGLPEWPIVAQNPYGRGIKLASYKGHWAGRSRNGQLGLGRAVLATLAKPVFYRFETSRFDAGSEGVTSPVLTGLGQWGSGRDRAGGVPDPWIWGPGRGPGTPKWVIFGPIFGPLFEPFLT